MKPPALTIACALGLLGAFFILRPSPPLLAQGSLTPPGAPAPVMKTLDQIEPRTPISALPFTISAPGSCYLTRNLTATADGTAITVSADNVTIDLNGFTLAGGATGTRAGIQAPVAQKSLCVRNGTLTGWSNSAIEANLVSGGSFENLRLTDNSGAIAVRPGSNATVRACVATGNTTTIFGTIALGPNSTISDCTASSNSSQGISADVNCTIINCTASGNAGSGISGCTIESNNPSNTANRPGLSLFGGGNRIDSNHFAGNGYAGLQAVSGGNLIIRNTFSGAQYILLGVNSVGPTVDMTAGGTISSASGTTTTGTNPWANIMF